MHAIVPPHPGPVAAAEALEANIGLTLLVGAPIAVVSWYIGAYLVSQFIGRRIHVDIPEALFGPMNGGRDEVTDRDDLAAARHLPETAATGTPRRRHRPARLRPSPPCSAYCCCRSS